MNLVDAPPKALSHDQFLFACRQALAARTTKAGFDSHLRHEPFLYGRFFAGQHLTVASWRHHLKEIFAHAFRASPQFRRGEDIGLETISFFSLAIATLVADLDSLMKHFSGNGLLPVLGVPLEKKEHDKLPALATLFSKYEEHLSQQKRAADAQHEMPEFQPFPFEDGDLAGSEAEQRDRMKTSEELWGTIFALVRQTFPKHHRSVVSFLLWHFQPEVPPAAIDWRVRPPVGEAFAQFQRSFQSGARAGAHFSAQGPGFRGGDRAPRGDRGDRGDRGAGRPGRPEHQAQAQVGTREERPPRVAKPEAPGAEARPSQATTSSPRTPPRERHREESPAAAEPQGRRGGGPTDLRPPQAAPEGAGSSPALLEEARKEVEHSIRILEKNSKRPGIRLKPQNSFVRREQHMVAAEKGFETESVGEGRDRAVYIKNRGH